MKSPTCGTISITQSARWAMETSPSMLTARTTPSLRLVTVAAGSPLKMLEDSRDASGASAKRRGYTFATTLRPSKATARKAPLGRSVLPTWSIRKRKTPRLATQL